MARLRTHPGEVLREEYLAALGLTAPRSQSRSAFRGRGSNALRVKKRP